jgi:hypothetical protein
LLKKASARSFGRRALMAGKSQATPGCQVPCPPCAHCDETSKKGWCNLKSAGSGNTTHTEMRPWPFRCLPCPSSSVRAVNSNGMHGMGLLRSLSLSHTHTCWGRLLCYASAATTTPWAPCAEREQQHSVRRQVTFFPRGFGRASWAVSTDRLPPWTGQDRGACAWGRWSLQIHRHC